MNNEDKIVRALRCSDEQDGTDNLGCSNKKCKYRDVDSACDIVSMCFDAAALIESQAREIKQIRADLVRVTAERDAAVADIMCRDHCDVCVSGHERDGECAKASYDCMTCKSTTCLCRECRNENKWQWCGLKGEEA